MEIDIDAEFENDARLMIARLRAYALEWYGERCEEFEPECACCKAWQAHDIVNDLVCLDN